MADTSVDPTSRIRLLDLGLSEGPHRREIDAAIARVLDSERFIHGPEVQGFEEELADWLGGGVTAVGVSNGSDALVLALMAAGVGPGDEVIVPAFTYAATATSVSLLGARPVFVDVAEPAMNIDLGAVEGALSERTRAIIPVHLYGRAVDWSALQAILDKAGRGDVVLVEDAAQALGAAVDGKAAGTLGELACFSFFPTKNLGAFGDAGAVVTGSDEAADTLRRLRNQGRYGRDDHAVLGMNARLDALQAAILRARLPHLRDWVTARRANARHYREALSALVGDGALALPADDGPDGRFFHAVHQFCLRVPQGRRDALREHLDERGIDSAIYYSRAVPSQPCFKGLGYQPGDFPVAERAALECVALPVHPRLEEAQLKRVASAVREFFERSA